MISKLLFLLAGVLIGGFVAVVFLCCMQINRIRRYEEEIASLHAKLEKE